MLRSCVSFAQRDGVNELTVSGWYFSFSKPQRFSVELSLSLSLGFSSCGLVWDCQFAFSFLGQISYKESMET